MGKWWTAGALGDSPEARALAQLERVIQKIPRLHGDRIVAADTTVVESDGLILADTTAAARTVTLPDASLVRGRRFHVKLWAGANNVTVQGSSGQTIDGAATKVWNTANTSFGFQAVITASPATFGWAIV